MPTFDTSPIVGEKVVVKTADNVYVGVVRRTTLYPDKSITLTDAFVINDPKIMHHEIYLTGDTTGDTWKYLSSEVPSIQSSIETIYASYYAHKMKYIIRDIIRDIINGAKRITPFQERMLQGIPENIRAAHYKSMMEDIVEHPTMDPPTRKIMLDIIPDEIQESYRMNANMNQVSINAFDLGPLPESLVRQHIIGLTKRPTKHAGRRSKTKRRSKRHLSKRIF